MDNPAGESNNQTSFQSTTDHLDIPPDPSATNIPEQKKDVDLPFAPVSSDAAIVTPPATEILNPIPSNPTPPAKPKGKAKLFMTLVGLIILLAVVCVGVAATAIAYEKLDIPNYPKVKATVTNTVVSIPFMPKTPKFLIAKTLIAHEKVTKHDYNISMSVDSPGFANVTGMSKLDIETKGAIDYENPDNIIFTLDASLTKDFNVELRKPDNFLYFKVNKIPAFLLALVGLQAGQFDPILEKWVAYDTTPLETESRQELKKDTEVENLSEEVLKEFEDKYLNDMVVKKLKIEKVVDDGGSFYKLSIDFDKETLDYIDKTLSEDRASTYSTEETAKLSDVIKAMNWSIFINSKTYLTHKITVTSDMEVDQISPTYGSAFLGTSDTLTQNSKVKFALVLKFDKFGEPVVVQKPSEFMTFEEFTSQFSEIMQKVYGQILNPSLSNVNDDRRRSDISSLKIIMELYKADCGSYPDTLAELVTPPASCTKARSYLSQLPKDPSGIEYYYKSNPAKAGYDICANLDTPIKSLTPCPDPNYNYHASFP